MVMFFPNSANDRPVAWKLISGICPPLTCWNTSSTTADISGYFEGRFTNSRNVEILSRQL